MKTDLGSRNYVAVFVHDFPVKLDRCLPVSQQIRDDNVWIKRRFGGFSQKWTPKFGPVGELDFSGSARGMIINASPNNRTQTTRCFVFIAAPDYANPMD